MDTPAAGFSGAIFGPQIHGCAACGSTHVKPWRKKAFSYTQGRAAEMFNIDRCEDCGSGFLNPPPSEAYLASIYAFSGHGLTSPVRLADMEASERSFPNSTLDAERLVRVGSALDLSGVADSLDVGSGMGFITREMKQQGRRAVSINPGAYENAVFMEMHGHMPVVGMLADYRPDRRFGLIVLSQVMEHMLEPRAVTQRLAEMLAPGGVLALAVPNFRSAAVALLGTKENGCLWVPEHVNYFSADGLSRMMRSAGLEVVRTAQVTRVRPDAIGRRIRVAKGLASAAVRLGQIPAAAMLNAVGAGLHLNIYARRAGA